ncbi:MAG: cytochrome c [Steroidobacteraceae bacterium]
MKALIAVLGAVISLAGTAAPVFAADAGQLALGKEKFDYWCDTCHAPDPREAGRYLPGTASLNAKYNGSRPGALVDRTDLLPPYVELVIRKGMEGMPFFRKTEISDAEMKAIAAYLSRNTRQ